MRFFLCALTRTRPLPSLTAVPSAQASSSQQGTATATQTRPQRDPALDGLRGVAVLLVYVFHYGGGLRATNPAVRAFGYLTQAGWVR